MWIADFYVEESLIGWVLIQVVREAIMISSSNLIPRNLQKLPCLFMVLICLKACNAGVRGTIESNLEFQSVFGEKQGWLRKFSQGKQWNCREPSHSPPAAFAGHSHSQLGHYESR